MTPGHVTVPIETDWVLLPREPDIGMLHELFAEPLPEPGPARLAVARDRYVAMLAKAPPMRDEDPEAIMDALAAAAPAPEPSPDLEKVAREIANETFAQPGMYAIDLQHQSLAAAILTALTTARAEGFAAGGQTEREAIVTWLRGGWERPVKHASEIADALERADHLPKESKDG